MNYNFLNGEDKISIGRVCADYESRVFLRLFEQGIYSYDLASLLQEFDISSVRVFLGVLMQLKEKEKQKSKVAQLIELSVEKGVDGEDPVVLLRLLQVDKRVTIDVIRRSIGGSHG